MGHAVSAAFWSLASACMLKNMRVNHELTTYSSRGGDGEYIAFLKKKTSSTDIVFN